MMNNRKLFYGLAAAFVAAASLAWWQLQAEGALTSAAKLPAREVVAAGEEPNTKRLEATVRRLQRQVDSLSRDVANAAPQAPVEPEVEPDRAAGEASDPVHKEEQFQLALRTELERRVDVEPTDPTWSRETEHSIEGFIEQRFTDARLEAVKCATTVCEVVASVPAGRTSQDLVDAFPQEAIAFDEAHWTKQSTDDGRSAIKFSVVRRGAGKELNEQLQALALGE